MWGKTQQRRPDSKPDLHLKLQQTFWLRIWAAAGIEPAASCRLSAQATAANKTFARFQHLCGFEWDLVFCFYSLIEERKCTSLPCSPAKRVSAKKKNFYISQAIRNSDLIPRAKGKKSLRRQENGKITHTHTPGQIIRCVCSQPKQFCLCLKQTTHHWDLKSQNIFFTSRFSCLQFSTLP